MKRNTYNICIIIFCVGMMICAYFIGRSKKQINEVKRLPFSNTSLENVEDGTYYGKTYTSFMRLQVNVTVENHKLIKIDFIENQGSKGKRADEMAERMIANNQVVVDLIDKDELGSLVLISCVDSALESAVSAEKY